MFGNTRGLTFDDVILVPGYNGIRSRQNVTTATEAHGHKFEIPLISSNMDTITGLEMANAMGAHGGMGILHRFMTIEENVKVFKALTHPKQTGISIGIGKDGMERAEALIAAGAEIICVDVAHGHSKEVNRTVRDLRQKFGDGILVIAGNVATYAGAEFVMLGGMLAGTDETPGEKISKKTADGKTVHVKRFRGMASREAQEDFMGNMSEWKTAEGVAIEVVCRGPMKAVLQDILGGIRSGMTYCGASTIKQLQRKAQFMEITPASRAEGAPHAIGRLTE